MSSIHLNPAAYGQRFGVVVVTIDRDLADCQLHPDVNGQRLKNLRFHSIDEMQLAYQVQLGRAPICDVAKDMAEALKYAIAELRPKGGRS